MFILRLTIIFFPINRWYAIENPLLLKEFHTQRKQKLIILTCVIWSAFNGLSLYPIYKKVCLDGQITHRDWLTDYNAGKYVDIILCFLSKVLVSCSVLMFNGKLVYIMWDKMRTKSAKIMLNDDFERKPLTSVDYACTDGSSSSTRKGFKKSSFSLNSSINNNHQLPLIKANSSIKFSNKKNNDKDVIIEDEVNSSMKRFNIRASEINKCSDKQKVKGRDNIQISSSINLMKRNQIKMKYLKKLKKMKLSCIVVLIITLPQIFADIGDFIAFILLALECKSSSLIASDDDKKYSIHNNISFINSHENKTSSCHVERNFTKTITYIKYGTELLLIISLYNNFIACLLSNRKFRRKFFILFV